MTAWRFLGRRALLGGSAAAAAAAGGALARAVPAAAAEAESAAALPPPSGRKGSFASVNGARIFYEVAGGGQPMLLIHGYPLSGALFVRVRDRLARRFRVVTLDLRGYGKSTTPSIPGSIGVYAEDALGLLTRLGISKAYVLGMSMGGPIALEMYLRARQRFLGLVLNDTVAAAAPPSEAGMWRGVAELARAGGVGAVIPQVNHFFLTGATRLNRPADADYLVAVQREASEEAAIGGAQALATRRDYTGLLGDIRVPTLVLVGAEDDVYPFEISRRISGAIRGSRLVIVPAAAHAAVFEAGQRSAEAILDWAS